MCKYHAQKGTPLEYLLHISHILRESLLVCIWSYCDDNYISVSQMKSIVPSIHLRLDSVQRHICSIYWEHTNSLLEQKDQTINQLHNDRLIMLGKMAASMAHELRNPLFAIEGFIQLIRAELSSSLFDLKKINGYFDVIQTEYKGLYGQITGFLSFSKHGGTVEEDYIACSSKEIIEPVLELINPRLINENIEIKLSLHTNNSALFIQKLAMQQVLSNLINNSIDALSSVTYLKKIEILSYEDDENYYLHVMDNGIGIPLELQENIFAPFVTNKRSGTGLGLAVSKQIMEKNKGNLNFTSKKGETKFTLSLGKD
jgi:signal transduction histidine kinase